MNLILFESAEFVLAPEASVALPASDLRAQHLQRVLCVKVGERVRVGLIDGPVGEAQVRALGPEGVELRLSFADLKPPPRPRVDLLLALPRPKALARLYSPMAQLGVGRVVLSGAARVERYYFDAHQVDPSWARPHLVEGLAQARDTRVPLVEVHRRLDDATESALCARADVAAPTLRLVADPGEAEAPRVALRGAAQDARVVVAVGPEGGFRDSERAYLAKQCFVPIALGLRTLRSDVAIVSLLALIHDALRS